MSEQPGDKNALLRLPESVQLRDVINVWYRGVLNVESTRNYADVVVWNESRYTVTEVSKFRNYGSGYTKAICVLEKPNA